MNDEELYQQASGELASERRDLRVWARACALAPEDHDEARFLYTNLRVEELLAERHKGAGDEATPNAIEPTSRDAPARGEPAPEAFAAAGNAASADGDRSDGQRPPVDDDDIGALFAALDDDADERGDPDGSGSAEPETEGAHAPAGVEDGYRARAPFGPPGDRDGAADGDAPESGDEALTDECDGSDRTERSDSRPPSGLDDDFDDLDDLDDLDWPDRKADPPRAARAPAHEPRLAPAPDVRDRPDAASSAPADDAAGNDAVDDALAAELERQARELPIAKTPSSTPATNVPLFDENARAGPVPDEVPTGALELDEGGRREYALYLRPGSREQAVSQGGSVAALLLTLPWLLYRGLFGTAVLYALFCAAVLAGLTITGLAWFDAGDAATTPTRLAFTAFALLALFGTIVAPWWQANRWRQEKLERRGFSLVARVRARSPKAAFAAFERESRGRVRYAAR